jgi:hypothetical protein
MSCSIAVSIETRTWELCNRAYICVDCCYLHKRIDGLVYELKAAQNLKIQY